MWLYCNFWNFLIIINQLNLKKKLSQKHYGRHCEDERRSNPASSGNTPVGGGAPIGGGLFILLGLGAAYGGKKIWDYRKKLEE